MTVTSLRAQGNVEDSRWETAVRCIKKYEGWHGPEHHPYVAYGHRIRKGEKFTARLTESEGDSILRKDLKEMCALFRHLDLRQVTLAGFHIVAALADIAGNTCVFHCYHLSLCP